MADWRRFLPGASVPTGPTAPVGTVASTVAISDGTNTANVIAGDSGNNAQVITGGRKEVTFTTTSVQAVATTDVSNYRWVNVWVNTQGTNSVVNFQSSNDNSNWISTQLASNSALAGSLSATSTTSTAVIFSGPLSGRYFRLNVTGISAGTTAGTVEFFSVPTALPNLTTSTIISKQNSSNSSPSLDSSFGSVTNNTSKASAGNVFAVYCSSVNTALAYFQLHNKASVPVNPNVPIYSFPLPAGTATVPSITNINEAFFGPAGKNFTTGIAWGISSTNGTFTDAGTAANYNVYVHYI